MLAFRDALDREQVSIHLYFLKQMNNLWFAGMIDVNVRIHMLRRVYTVGIRDT